MFKQNPSILIFFQSKNGAPLSFADVKCLLNQRSFYEFLNRAFFMSFDRGT